MARLHVAQTSEHSAYFQIYVILPNITNSKTIFNSESMTNPAICEGVLGTDVPPPFFFRNPAVCMQIGPRTNFGWHRRRVPHVLIPPPPGSYYLPQLPRARARWCRAWRHLLATSCFTLHCGIILGASERSNTLFRLWVAKVSHFSGSPEGPNKTHLGVEFARLSFGVSLDLQIDTVQLLQVWGSGGMNECQPFELFCASFPLDNSQAVYAMRPVGRHL